MLVCASRLLHATCAKRQEYEHRYSQHGITSPDVAVVAREFLVVEVVEFGLLVPAGDPRQTVSRVVGLCPHTRALACTRAYIRGMRVRAYIIIKCIFVPLRAINGITILEYFRNRTQQLPQSRRPTRASDISNTHYDPHEDEADVRSENQKTRREGDEVGHDELHGVCVDGGEGEGRRELVVLLVVDLIQVLGRVRRGQHQLCKKTVGCMHHHCGSLNLLPKLIHVHLFACSPFAIPARAFSCAHRKTALRSLWDEPLLSGCKWGGVQVSEGDSSEGKQSGYRESTPVGEEGTATNPLEIKTFCMHMQRHHNPTTHAPLPTAPPRTKHPGTFSVFR